MKFTITPANGIFILSIITVLFCSCHGKEKYHVVNGSIDTAPKTLMSYIPHGYTVLNQSSGDANLDGITDCILVLKENEEDSNSDYADDRPSRRPLLLLLGMGDSLYRLAYRNDNAVLCVDCGGVFGDPFTGTTIKNGYFSIEHGIAGGIHWEQVTTFKFDKSKDNWFLYKDHFISYKLNNSTDENAEALIKDRETLKTANAGGLVPFIKFNIYTKTID